MDNTRYRLETKTMKLVVKDDPSIFNPANNSSQAHDICNALYSKLNLSDDQEHFGTLFMDNNNKVVGAKVLFSGGSIEAIVDVGVLYRLALMQGATNMICFHTHPSGAIVPSDADIRITRDICKIGRILRIKLHDHLILGMGTNDYCSMSSDGILNTICEEIESEEFRQH